MCAGCVCAAAIFLSLVHSVLRGVPYTLGLVAAFSLKLRLFLPSRCVGEAWLFATRVAEYMLETRRRGRGRGSGGLEAESLKIGIKNQCARCVRKVRGVKLAGARMPAMLFHLQLWIWSVQVTRRSSYLIAMPGRNMRQQPETASCAISCLRPNAHTKRCRKAKLKNEVSM